MSSFVYNTTLKQMAQVENIRQGTMYIKYEAHSRPVMVPESRFNQFHKLPNITFDLEVRHMDDDDSQTVGVSRYDLDSQSVVLANGKVVPIREFFDEYFFMERDVHAETMRWQDANF